MMADGQGRKPRSKPRSKPSPDRQEPDLQVVARDWITIWQSELSALTTDRELQNVWVRLVKMWADAAARATRLLPPSRASTNDEQPSGHAGPAAPARATSVVVPPDDRDAAIRRLAERVAELERRLAAHERSRNVGDGTGDDNDT